MDLFWNYILKFSEKLSLIHKKRVPSPSLAKESSEYYFTFTHNKNFTKLPSYRKTTRVRPLLAESQADSNIVGRIISAAEGTVFNRVFKNYTNKNDELFSITVKYFRFLSYFFFRFSNQAGTLKIFWWKVFLNPDVNETEWSPKR